MWSGPFANLASIFAQRFIATVMQTIFNGTITNDKICLSRMAQLQLSWWRLPLRARVPVTPHEVYPPETNEPARSHQEDTNEETVVENPT